MLTKKQFAFLAGITIGSSYLIPTPANAFDLRQFRFPMPDYGMETEWLEAVPKGERARKYCKNKYGKKASTDFKREGLKIKIWCVRLKPSVKNNEIVLQVTKPKT